MSNIYAATLLSGGTAGALDTIGGASLTDKDAAIAFVQGSGVYFYILDADSGASESLPNVIAPDSGADTKRWILHDILPAGLKQSDTIVPSSGSGSIAAWNLGTALSPLVANDFPIVIKHFQEGSGHSYGVHIQTTSEISDTGSGLVVENLGASDGATFAVGSTSLGACAIGAFINHTTDVTQYVLSLANYHGKAIIIQSKGTGESIHIRRNGNEVGTAKTGSHILINEVESGNYGHLVGFKAYANAASTDSDAQLIFYKSTSEKFRVNIDGSFAAAGRAIIGGVTTPVSSLEVWGQSQTVYDFDTTASRAGQVQIDGGTAGVGSGGGILFGAFGGDVFASIRGYGNNGNSYSIGGLCISLRNNVTDTTLTNRVYITYDGLVGINTTSPAARLSVNGGCHIGGDTNPGDGALLVDGEFGCNGKAVQAAYVSGGALSAYSTGSYGYDSAAHAQEIHTLLTNIRAALVANGIMS